MQINQLIRVPIWQRLQKNAVDHTKDRTICPDTDGQGKNAHRGESGIVQQTPSGKGYIGNARRDEVLPSVGAHLFADGRRIAKTQPYRAACRVGDIPLASKASAAC